MTRHRPRGVILRVGVILLFYFFDLTVWKLNGDPGKKLSNRLTRTKTAEKLSKLILWFCKSKPDEHPTAKELQLEIQKDMRLSNGSKS